ncbi:MAG TPA: hypothetical protein VGK29_09345 [Paludibaculum sp.]
MTRSALAVALLIAQSAFTQTLVREFTYNGNLTPLNIRPSFDNGHLITYTSQHTITIRPPQGAPAFTLSAHEPAAGASMSNAAVDTDGVIATSVLGEKTIGIAIFRPDGNQERIIQTGPYLPSTIRFGTDHTIWTLGEPIPHIKPQPDYAVLRNYSRDGRLLGAYLPRSTFKTDAMLVPSNHGFVLLHIAAGRVGMMLDFTQDGRDVQWLETDVAGKETGRWALPRGYWVHGVTTDGTVYATGNPGSPLVALHRETREWKTLSIPAEGKLIGVDGEHLVFLEHPSGLAQWFTPPK